MNRIPQTWLAHLLAALILLPGAKAEVGTGTTLLTLKNEQAEVSVFPAGAGRVVIYRRPGGQNILKANPAMWEGAEPLKFPPIEKWTSDVNPNGQIHWAGPQPGFWNQQTLYPERKNQVWPPDPWSEIVAYTLVEQTPEKLVLRGPESPITGLIFTKAYELAADGKLSITVTAQNARAEAVKWDLWSVTRVSAAFPAFARVRGSYSPLLAESGTTATSPPIPWKLTKGIFSLQQEVPLAQETLVRTRKAFLVPPAGPTAIVYIRGDEVFVKRFTPATPEECAPGHAPIEIYLEQRKPEAGGVMELEFHSPYRTLAPGDSMSISETWELRKIEVKTQREEWEEIARGILVP